MIDSIAILDFGSQYAQLIARRIREAHVYCELFPWDSSPEEILALRPKGFILSGGPASVYEGNAPTLPLYVLESKKPILGICYGMQLLAHTLGGKVSPSQKREYGPVDLDVPSENPLSPRGNPKVWMSHGDKIASLPPGFEVLGSSRNSPIAFMGDLKRQYYGLQFHPEIQHTYEGKEILRRFVINVCNAQPNWTTESIIAESIQQLRERIGTEKIISAVSGGVDSSVATALVQRAVGDQLTGIFVDTGLLREGEAAQVIETLKENLGAELIVIDAVSKFLRALRGITAPEEKRRIIGELFIRTFEEKARQIGTPRFLAQGTIYPDVVESSAPDRNKAQRIKTHHNVGGLPPEINFEIVEPLRYLFKDEVRAVGEILGLPRNLVWRQPFPGPGLAVRCLGEITQERLERLRNADTILISELENANLLPSSSNFIANDTGTLAQAFTVLLPVSTVGVMGDQRTYQEVIVLRAVTTDDFMTADWARLPHELLAQIANRIVNEVEGVNRVVYDITSKPPATIEWE